MKREEQERERKQQTICCENQSKKNGNFVGIETAMKSSVHIG